MRRFVVVLLALLLVLPLLAIGYEVFAVTRARVRTPEILAAAWDRPVKLSMVGRRRLDMLLRVEDPGFFRHRGIDDATPGAGRTTLTQALVKRLYFDGGFRPGFARIEQSLIARFVLHPALGKRDQLELFLNRASFGSAKGRPIAGFDEAARAFYGRPLTGLDDRQYLSLVAMLIAPGDLNPLRHPRENEERTARIEALLAGRCRPRDFADVWYEDCAAEKLRP